MKDTLLYDVLPFLLVMGLAVFVGWAICRDASTGGGDTGSVVPSMVVPGSVPIGPGLGWAP